MTFNSGPARKINGNGSVSPSVEDNLNDNLSERLRYSMTVGPKYVLG